MKASVRIHQARALAEAIALDRMPAAPKAVRAAQAKRVFAELKAMTGVGANDDKKQVRRHWWWLDPEE